MQFCTPQQFLELARRRRTARRYRRTTVPGRSIRLLAEALRWAPSAANTQPWEIIIVDHPGLLSQLKSSFLEDAESRQNDHYKLVTAKQAEILDHAVLLGIAGDTSTLDEYIDADQISVEGKEELFLLSMGAAIQNLLLMATTLGLATTWIARLARIPAVAESLHIVPPLRLVAFVALGRGARPSGFSENLRLPMAEKLHHNRFGTGFPG